MVMWLSCEVEEIIWWFFDEIVLCFFLIDFISFLLLFEINKKGEKVNRNNSYL